MKQLVVFILIIILATLPTTVYATDNFILISNESWSKHTTLIGKVDQPIIIAPMAKLQLSEKTQKIILVPEELNLKEEYQEFRLFRNRYVLFGVYLSLALAYNWLTRYRR